MLHAQETEKKKIAHKLHEGVAQTLAAIKNNIELSCTKQLKNHPEDDLLPLQQTVTILQDLIQEIRALTMENLGDTQMQNPIWMTLV